MQIIIDIVNILYNVTRNSLFPLPDIVTTYITRMTVVVETWFFSTGSHCQCSCHCQWHCTAVTGERKL